MAPRIIPPAPTTAQIASELSSTFAKAVALGAPKGSDNTRYLGIPGQMLYLMGTRAHSINQSRYYPFRLPAACTLDQLSFEVTAAPASNANVRVGLVRADNDRQPTGAALFDIETAVASGFTGVKTATIADVALTPGRYLLRTNVDVTMTFRVVTVLNDGFAAPALGANALAEFVYVAEAYGPIAGTPAKWGSVGATTTGLTCPVFLRWTAPDPT